MVLCLLIKMCRITNCEKTKYALRSIRANPNLTNSYCKQEALSSESGYGGEITETQTTELRLLMFVSTLQTATGC
jgi:hypothetical protein